MVRLLPGVRTSINDLSSLPEGYRSLTVGLVLQSKRGKIGEATLNTNTNDYLKTCTYTGKPHPKDDKSILVGTEILKECNQLYTVRAAKNALYGGLVIKKEDILGDVTAMTTGKVIKVTGDVTTSIAVDDTIRVSGVTTNVLNLDKMYTVVSKTFNSPDTDIVVNEAIGSSYTFIGGTKPRVYIARQPKPLNQEVIGTIVTVDQNSRTFTLTGDYERFMPVGDKIQIKDSTGNDGIYTTVSATFATPTTTLVVAEDIPVITADGVIYRNSLVEPKNYAFKDEDLFLLAGIDQGSYNANLQISLTSSSVSPEDFVDTNVMQLTVRDALTNAVLETPYTFSRDITAKTIDGQPLYIEDILNTSAYIQVVNNEAVLETELPSNSNGIVRFSGGSDGDTLTDADLVAALNIFLDKTIPLSLLANGSVDSADFRKAMLGIAETRGDCLPFLNTRLLDEMAQTNTVKATNVVNYKKNSIASATYKGAMYAPHVNLLDTFNSRRVKVGADAVIIPGWLRTIRTLGYPKAFAGPRNGLVNNVTIDWKIGDESGEAVLLNDASVNFIAYDPKQGRYYVQNQNTLQIANSSLRNIGTFLNILDIKESLATALKEYLQLDITDDLREDINFTATNYMQLVRADGRLSNFVWQDISTPTDIADNRLKYILTLAPTAYAQDIVLSMNIVNQAFDFTILQST